MNTPSVPKQKTPISRFVPRLNQHVGVLWLWGTKLAKKASKTEELLLEVFGTHDVAETLHQMKADPHGPRRDATHVAFEPFEKFEEAKEYAAQAAAQFEPANQPRPAEKAEQDASKDTSKETKTVL